jgi:motility quorum-sensing regulator/GCU-specific mRNA interferase toxin
MVRFTNYDEGLTYYPQRVIMTVMEKRSPHYDLVRVQSDVSRLKAAAFTKSSLDGGRALGLTVEDMIGVIAKLSPRQFYKSMTTYADHRVWQDVYVAPTPVQKDAYIKVTLRGHAPVIQFKEK